MNRLPTLAACLFLALASCGASQTSSKTTPSGAGGAFERPSGQQTLKKGESHNVEINAGEKHEWGIDLAAGEKVTFAMQATSTGPTMCQNWGWGYYNARGDVLRETVEVPAESGQWSDQIEGTAQPSVTEDPAAGRYLVRVTADPTSCPQLHYTLTAR
jgi:hypothetical protein